MRQNLFPTGQFHRLAPPGDIRGVSCDQNGPAIGPIRLMVKKGSRFAPRPVEELNRIFSLVIRRPIDCDDLVERLQSVTRALNESQFARAIFATQYLHLPALTDEEAQRAVGAEALLKAAPDDPKHPGWPKGTEGGKGGKFRAKDSAAGESREQTVADQKENIADRMARSGRRKIIRSTLRRMLSLRQGARFIGEGLSQLAPVLDVIGDVALLHDINEMTDEALKLKSETDAAVEFVNNGLYDLDQLRVSQDDESFPSFNEFKKVDLVKRVGPAGDGFEYHHIVEQNGGGDIPEGDVQSTKNIIRIPKLLHEEITSEFAKTDEISGVPLRQTLVGKSFNERWNAGVKVLSRVGIINRD